MTTISLHCKVAIYVPEKCRFTTMLAASGLARICGGSTTHHTWGSYIRQDTGLLETENVEIVEAFFDGTAPRRPIAEALAQTAYRLLALAYEGQESVAIQINGALHLLFADDFKEHPSINLGTAVIADEIMSLGLWT